MCLPLERQDNINTLELHFRAEFLFKNMFQIFQRHAKNDFVVDQLLGRDRVLRTYCLRFLQIFRVIVLFELRFDHLLQTLVCLCAREHCSVPKLPVHGFCLKLGEPLFDNSFFEIELRNRHYLFSRLKGTKPVRVQFVLGVPQHPLPELSIRPVGWILRIQLAFDPFFGTNFNGCDVSERVLCHLHIKDWRRYTSKHHCFAVLSGRELKWIF